MKDYNGNPIHVGDIAIVTDFGPYTGRKVIVRDVCDAPRHPNGEVRVDDDWKRGGDSVDWRWSAWLRGRNLVVLTNADQPAENHRPRAEVIEGDLAICWEHNGEDRGFIIVVPPKHRQGYARQINDAIAAAIQQEREACAAIADMEDGIDWYERAGRIAAKIRARS